MKKVYATCIVRPFWFMVDKMERSDRSEKIDDYKERAKHLKYFMKSSNIDEAKRILILSLDDIAGILLTAYIETILPQNDTMTRNKNLGEIPEIDWFHREVNSCRGVELFYVYKDEGKKEEKEFLNRVGDRVVVEEEGQSFFLKFIFKNGNEFSRNGNLEIGYDVDEDIFNWCRNPAGSYGPSASKEFSNLLQTLSPQREQDIIDLVDSSFQKFKNELGGNYTNYLSGIVGVPKGFLKSVIENVGKAPWVKPTNPSVLNESLKSWFKTNGHMGLSIIFENDDKIFPIKIASWAKNWAELLK